MISENQIGTIDFLFYLMWCLIYWVGLEPTRPSPMGGADYRPNRDVGKKQKDLKLDKWIVGIGPKQKSRVVFLFVYFVLIPKTWCISQESLSQNPFQNLTYLPNPTRIHTVLSLGFGNFWGFRVRASVKSSRAKMQQNPQMIPVMPSFPPNNITTEQIQKVWFRIPFVCFYSFGFLLILVGVLELKLRVLEIIVCEF